MILLFLSAQKSFAAKIILNSGEEYQGTIKGNSERSVGIETKDGIFVLNRSDIASFEEDSESSEENQEDVGEEEIRIHPLMELDFMSQADILELRKQFVAEHKMLWEKIQESPGPQNPWLQKISENFKPVYKPNQEIFEQIEDGKPWWGITGLCYYGPGEQAIEGPSEESRFLINPYLLVGVDYAHGFIVNRSLEPMDVYPEPSQLIWDIQNKRAQVRYAISEMWEKETGFHFPDSSRNDRKLNLIAYNAKDLGFRYFYVIPELTQGVEMGDKREQAFELKQFIHCGGSCGYSGGCNNMSPHLDEMELRVRDLPATVTIALWRSRPQSVRQDPDMIFTLELV